MATKSKISRTTNVTGHGRDKQNDINLHWYQEGASTEMNKAARDHYWKVYGQKEAARIAAHNTKTRAEVNNSKNSKKLKKAVKKTRKSKTGTGTGGATSRINRKTT